MGLSALVGGIMPVALEVQRTIKRAQIGGFVHGVHGAMWAS